MQRGDSEVAGEVGVEAIIDNPRWKVGLSASRRASTVPKADLLLDPVSTAPGSASPMSTEVEESSRMPSNADVGKSGSMTLLDSSGLGDQPWLALRRDACDGAPSSKSRSPVARKLLKDQRI